MKSCRLADDAVCVGDINTLKSAITIPSHPGVSNDHSSRHVAGMIAAVCRVAEFPNKSPSVYALNSSDCIRLCNVMASTASNMQMTDSGANTDGYSDLIQGNNGKQDIRGIVSWRIHRWQ